MKTIRGIIVGLFLLACCASKGAAFTTVPFSVTQQQFNQGDSIVIDNVEVSSLPLRKFSEVHVRGHYQLASAKSASLGLFVTHWSRPASGPDKTAPSQIVEVDKQTGTFKLSCVLSYPGSIHVSFYPVSGGESFGGLYFALVKP